MHWISYSIVVCGLILTCGCQPTEVSSGGSEEFGYFNGDVVATWNVDGRKMTLTQDFEYVDSNDRRWVAPSGTTVDGASIPGAFWTFIGGPFEGKYRFASVVHDIECEQMTSSWEDVHRMFYEAMRCAGVSDAQAKTMYYAVYHFGPRWEPVEQTSAPTDESIEVLSNERVARSKSGGRQMRRYQPPPPTQEELDQLTDFIQEEDPNIVAIERTTRETLRRRRPRVQHHADASSQQDQDSIHSERSHIAGANTSFSPEPSSRDSTRNAPDNNQRSSGSQNLEMVFPVDDLNERQWVIAKVVNHLAPNLNQQIPATYDIEQSSDEYRVRMQVYSQTRRGDSTGYHDEELVLRVSKAGEVLEVMR